MSATIIDYWRWLAAVAGDDLQAGAHGAGWTAQAALDLLGVHVELREGAAESVAVHAELFGGLALVAAMAGEDFCDETLFELTDRIGVGNAGGMHLEDEAVEFAFHVGAIPSMLKFYSVAGTSVKLSECAACNQFATNGPA